MPEKSRDINNMLNAFGRRHYLNHFLQGLAVFVVSSLIVTAILSIAEYISKNESLTREILFYSYLVLLITGFLYLVLIPALRMTGILSIMSPEQLSVLIGKRVVAIEDKLLNVLLLRKMQLPEGRNELVMAAIRQKSADVLKTDFHLAATLKKGKNFVMVAGFILVLMTLFAWSFPDVINYGTKRIIYYNVEIMAPAPFHFEISHSPHAIKNERFEITARITGEVLPKQVFIELNGERKAASKTGYDEFSYAVRKVGSDLSFRFFAEGYYSEEERIEMISRPSVLGFIVTVTYPEYLKMESEELKNTGNLTVPEGSSLNWKIQANSSSSVAFNFENTRVRIPVKEEHAEFDSTLYRDVNYSIWASGRNGLFSDSINYRIEVLPDEYPGIEVRTENDSTANRANFFGRYSDDHGISAFLFAYKINNGAVQLKELQSKGRLGEEFIYQIKWADWDLKKGDRLHFYFEVWDNDGINGKKSSRSQTFTHVLPDDLEIKAEKEKLSEEISKAFNDALKEAKQLNRKIDDLRKELIQKDEITWNEKKQIEDILRENEELKNKIERIEEKHARKNEYENQVGNREELTRKREELQDLLKEVLNEEMLEKIKELQELMEKLNREQLNRAMEDLQMSNEQLEQELDRSLELFKQLEFEIKLDEVLEEIERLEHAQKELRQEGEQKAMDEKMLKEQKKISEDFGKWEEEFKKLKEINEGLQEKNELKDFGEERKNIKESMEKSEEGMEKGNKKNTRENQQNAEENMDAIKSGLQGLKAAMQDQEAEDLQSLRNTLENLIELSFNQEDILGEMKNLRAEDPRFNELTRDQRAVLEGFKMAEDSLKELGRRISQIAPVVNRELNEGRRSMERSIRAMTERELAEMSVQQQLAMTSINNLGLLIDEIVDQMQQQMMQSMGQCKKPGNSRPRPSSMMKLQQQLNQQIEEMKKMMEKGNSGGMNKTQAESLAKMAAEQAKIREELRKLEQDANQQISKELRKIRDMMEETEKDLVNRQISRETLMRQEEIMTRLLESEKSEREQDLDEKRISNTGNDKKNGNLLDLKEYYKAREKDHEKLMKENISYDRYYKKRVEEYFKSLAE